jgi:hypothetical protein
VPYGRLPAQCATLPGLERVDVGAAVAASGAYSAGD